ncbi:MAG: hypothetical protein PWP46_1509 [Fusobacteriaceae bacterium]|nr:hypothetical protein [Fusobacteriaceae bacterium]
MYNFFSKKNTLFFIFLKKSGKYTILNSVDTHHFLYYLWSTDYKKFVVLSSTIPQNSFSNHLFSLDLNIITESLSFLINFLSS